MHVHPHGPISFEAQAQLAAFTMIPGLFFLMIAILAFPALIAVLIGGALVVTGIFVAVRMKHADLPDTGTIGR